MENKLRKFLRWLKTLTIRNRQKVSEEIFEEIELQNFSSAWESKEEFIEDAILEESLSKDETKKFTAKTERRLRSLFFSNPVLFLFAVPTMLNKDALNPNLPFVREMSRTKERT